MRQLALLIPAIALLVVASGALPVEVGAWIALVAVFFAPGFLLWLALPRRIVRDIAALPALLFVTSFALIAPPLFIALLLDTSVGVVLWSVVAELLLLSWFAARREGIPVRWPRAPGLFLITFVVVAGAATLRFFTVNEFGDDAAYVGMIEAIRYTDSFPSMNPWLAGDLSLAPRWALDGWTGSLGTIASLSDIDGSVLYMRFLPPLLLVLGASAAYLLARFLTYSERFGLAAAAVAVLLPLLAEPKANPSQYLFWYRAIQHDKYAGLLIFFPVVVTFFLASYHRPRPSLVLASAVLLLGLVLMHPIIATLALTAAGSYALTHSILNLRFGARRFAWLACAAAPAVVAGAILASSQGGFGVDFGEINSLSDVFVPREVGPITFWVPRSGPRLLDVPIEEANNFFINYHLSLGGFDRLMFLTKDLFIVSPEVLATPINLFVPAAALLLLLRQRRSPLTAFVVGSSLAAVTVMFVPPVARIVTVAVPPFQLWRFAWLLPVGLAATWLYTVWLRQAARTWLIAGSLLVLVVVWTPHDKLLTLTTTNRFPLEAVAQELETYDGVLLAHKGVGDPLLTRPAGLRLVAFRGGAVMSNAFPGDRREEALQRMQDRARFFMNSTSLSDRLAILGRHGITHVLVRRDRQAALGFDALPLRHAADLPMGFVLYEVVPQKPNILVITTDDQRVGPENEIVMPNLKRLFVDDGTKYENAFVTTPLCGPSRSSILTGQCVHNHGVLTNFDTLVLDHSRTIQAYLHEAGYYTGQVGKFLNRWPIESPPPHFDRWWITEFLPGSDYYGLRWNVNGVIQNIDQYHTTYVKERAVDFLSEAEERDGEPWLLFVSVYAPHSPFTPEPKYQDAPVPPWAGNPAVQETDKSDKRPYVQQAAYTVEDGQRWRAGQLRSLMSVDDMLADIFDELDILGEDNTLAIYISDNGLMWGEHGLKGKRLPYTEAVHVPLMVRWPGHVDAGKVVSTIAANIDIAPTVLEAAGVPVPDDMAGRPLLAPTNRASILLENFGGKQGTWASLRTEDWQYVEYYENTGRVVSREYYDLQQDPWQLVNLLQDGDPSNDPDAQLLHEQLRVARQCAGQVCP